MVLPHSKLHIGFRPLLLLLAGDPCAVGRVPSRVVVLPLLLYVWSLDEQIY